MGLLDSMGLFLDSEYGFNTVKRRPNKMTYWKYNEKTGTLKQIDYETMVDVLDEYVVFKMERLAQQDGSANVQGFIVQWNNWRE